MTTPSHLRSFHQAAWNEPLLHEQASPGERGFDPPATEPAIAESVGDGVSAIPPSLRRSAAPALPELAQPAVLRHFLRLSQETLGQDIDIHLGLGTCTMKYSPKVNEALIRSHKVTHLHPWQDDDTAQGILEAMYRLERIICEISGMERASFQPGGGTQAVYANARMISACQTARGQGHRDEIITTVFSHPCDGAGPATAGYKLVTLYPESDGLPALGALKAALSERTAGLMITNPEDTGIFNPEIDRIVELVQAAGGICHYDQANANGILGITRARDAGFDLCQFNLHKTFGSPHCSMGMPVGVSAVSGELAPYLPAPTVEFDGNRYFLDDARPHSIGKVRAFHGVPATVVRAYAWILALGAEGLREVAEIAVLNNNYLAQATRGRAGPRRRVRGRQCRTSPRADPLLLAAAHGGDGRDHARSRAAHERLRSRPVLPEPRALGGARTDDARAGRDRLARRPRHLCGDHPRRRTGGLRRSRDGTHVPPLLVGALPRPGTDGRPRPLGDDLACLAPQAWLTR